MKFFKSTIKIQSIPKISKVLSRSVTKTTAVILSIALLAQTGMAEAAVTNEQVAGSYTSAINGQSVINNLKYTDINNFSYDLKDAIYQNGALDLLKGFGSQKFNPDGTISKEMALYLAYMAANRAQDIVTQGEALNNARPAAQKKTSLQDVLYDGSLQLAANEGLITQQELTEALQPEDGQQGTAFKRRAAVQRQEFAAWLAKTLMVPPAYNQQELFNSYSDWYLAKAENVPYIEALLQNNIMSGSGAGKFSPTGSVTRQQAARILKNAEDIILPIRNMEKRNATIEDIQTVKDTSKGYRMDYTSYLVRNSDGLLNEIIVETRYQKPATTSNELNGAVQPSLSTEIPVYKDGKITNSQSLKKGDRIEYIAGIEDKIVRYARVLSNSGEISYIAAYVNSVDNNSRTMNITPLKQAVQYPDQEISSPDKKTDENGNIIYENRSYSNNLLDAVTKAPVDKTAIKPENIVILGIKQDMIVELVTVRLTKEKEKGLSAGIVEENNPQLGYITLYNEDGTGKTPLALSTVRTFNYADPNSVEVYKNHEPAELDDIEAGDTVFIRIDDSGTVSSVSSVSNYTVRYGKVISKKVSSITVETDKGRQFQYSIDGVDVIKDGKLSKISQLKDGDRVKLLVNEAPNITILKEISIEAGDKLVSNIYKGMFKRYDDISDKLVLSDPWILRNGQWVKDTTQTFKSIELGDNFTAYYGGVKQSKKNLNTRMTSATVYIAGEKDYGNGETGVVATFVNELDKEVPYNDKVYSTGTNRFTLEKAMDSITYNEGTIVVKDGRLVQGSSVSPDDLAYVMANRDSDTGKLIAGVVSIEQRANTQAASLYRGRISSIDEYKTVTLESYSRLNGVNWEYANTPMTFSLTSDTRITDSDGIVGQAAFNSNSGADTFKGRTIYILSDGTNAVEISTAPYGSINISGEVLSTSGGTIGEDGKQLEEPNVISLRNCRYYNSASNLWVTMNDSSFNLLTNSLVIKNNTRIKPSALKKGDKIKVLKKDNSTSGDAYVIIVED